MTKRVCLVDPGNEIVYNVADHESYPQSLRRSYWQYAVEKRQAWWIVPLKDDVPLAALEDPGDWYRWYDQLLPWMEADVATPLDDVSFTVVGRKFVGYALVSRGSDNVTVNFALHAAHFDTWDIDEPEEGLDAIVRVEVPPDIVDQWQAKYPAAYPRDPRWHTARLIPHATLAVPYRQARQYIVEPDEDDARDGDDAQGDG